ncbi:MarR family winged helix-turn-helix transcriptional regulator [Spongisporangium articulatum]|uniref:MarR family winged helix-turn-helix transcriptional regulator n=1 Tax=Spongisporangium articulatum TaxID=3362603 RepID=A0ABW8AQW8_9ACTN
MADVGEFFIRLVRAETLLYNAVDARLQADFGLSLGQLQFLQIVARRGTTRVLDLATEVGITVGATSKAVDRLVERGWAERAANPDDRRSSLLTLTRSGSALLMRATRVFEAELTARLRGVVTDAELTRTTAALAALHASLAVDR